MNDSDIVRRTRREHGDKLFAFQICAGRHEARSHRIRTLLRVLRQWIFARPDELRVELVPLVRVDRQHHRFVIHQDEICAN